MLCSYSSCHAMLVLHRILVHAMLFCCMLMVGNTCCYAHEPNLNVDQVCHRTELFSCSHNCRYGTALMRYTCGLSYAYSPKWEATRGSCLGQVNGGRPDSHYVLAPSPFGTSFGPRDGWSHAMVVSG